MSDEVDPRFQWLKDDLDSIKEMIGQSEDRTGKRIDKLEKRVDGYDRFRIVATAMLAVIIVTLVGAGSLSTLLTSL